MALKDRIASENVSDLLDELLFLSPPFLFASDLPAYRLWRAKLAKLLMIDPNEIFIVGSAAVGSSLNPRKNFKTFDAASDVDVAVISEYHFSESWHFLRRMDFNAPGISPLQRSALFNHISKYIYYGCIATDKILPLLPFASTWLPAKSEMAGCQPTEGREVNFRIYKDLRALRGYQVSGMARLQQNLLQPG